MSWFNTFFKKSVVMEPVAQPVVLQTVNVSDYPLSQFSAYWEIMGDEVRFYHYDGRLLETHSVIGDQAKASLVREKMESYRK